MDESKYSQIRGLTIEQKCYLAGIIDADGTITFSGPRTRKDGSKSLPQPMILVVNTHWPLIEWLKETIGHGCAYITKATKLREDQSKENWNPVHRYQITGRMAIELCEQIRPYLMIKSEHAEIMCMTPIRGRDFSSRSTPDQKALGLKLSDHMRKLNARRKKPQPSLLS